MTLTSDQIHALLTAGSLAPSGGNCQPWRARARSRSIELSLDPAWRRSIIDACGHAAVMALGSFAENVTLAARAMGLRATSVVRDGDPGNTRLVEVHFAPDHHAARDELVELIPVRATNRQPHVGAAISDTVVDRLRAAAHNERGHWLQTVAADDDKRAVADILARADRVRVRNRALHREMFSELRWSPAAAAESGDGIDVRSLHVPAAGHLLLRLMCSYRATQYLPKTVIEALSRRLLVQSSHLCALVMPKPLTLLSWFEAGRTIQRVWLTAERYQLSIHPWTVLPFLELRAPCHTTEVFSAAEQSEIADLNLRLRTAFAVPENRQPFFVFRLFSAQRSPARAPRRPWQMFTELDLTG
jgi:hypothetical protein